MNQKVLLPLVAGLLVLVAVGGVVGGLVVISDGSAETVVTETAAHSEPGVVERTPAAKPAPVQPETQPASQPEAAADDSFIRFGVRTPPARTPGAIRLATYNVENLFDAIDDPELSGRNEDIDDTKPEAHVIALANTIRTLDADVLALEEIESEAVLTWFRDTYLSDLGYTYLASIDAGDDRGIEQAVLSRYPIAEITNWPHRPLGGIHPEKWGSSENWNAGEPITFHRSPLRVVIDIPAADGDDDEPYQLTLFVVHAKSGGPGAYWRLAEAAGLAEILDQDTTAHPDENIAILGDFNAFLSDESVQVLTSLGYTDALAAVVDRSPRFQSHESGRRIDHILVNANLQHELIPTSGFILGTPSLPEGVSWREPWRPDGYASDHFPVAIELVPDDRKSPEHRGATNDN